MNDEAQKHAAWCREIEKLFPQYCAGRGDAAADYIERQRRLMTLIYTIGYKRGHHDTVEGAYIDVLPLDQETYFDEDVAELLSEIDGPEEE